MTPKNNLSLALGILLGFVATTAGILLGAYIFITQGWMPANADGRPPLIEKWAARRSLRATLQRDALKTPNPVEMSDANLVAGIRLYSVHCAVCHGAADAQASNIAKGLYQQPPQLAHHGVEDDPDGKIEWIVAHGIRLTGMPAFSHTLTEKEVWQLVLFLKHMDQLPPAAEKAWKAVPSAA